MNQVVQTETRVAAHARQIVNAISALVQRTGLTLRWLVNAQVSRAGGASQTAR